MRSLSSIVKPESLYEPAHNVEKSKFKGIKKPREIEKIATDEPNEKSALIIRQAIRKSQRIDYEAAKRANDLIEKALENRHTIEVEARKSGYEDGYKNGFDQGAKAAEKAVKKGLDEIDDLIQSIQAERCEAIQRSEKDLIQIAFEIAKKIMKQQIQMDETAIPKMLEEVIRENEAGLKIYLSQYHKTFDYHLDKSIAKKISSISKNAKVVMVKEQDIIMAETENGLIDLSIPVQLNQLKDAVEAV